MWTNHSLPPPISKESWGRSVQQRRRLSFRWGTDLFGVGGSQACVLTLLVPLVFVWFHGRQDRWSRLNPSVPVIPLARPKRFAANKWQVAWIEINNEASSAEINLSRWPQPEESFPESAVSSVPTGLCYSLSVREGEACVQARFAFDELGNRSLTSVTQAE